MLFLFERAKTVHCSAGSPALLKCTVWAPRAARASASSAAPVFDGARWCNWCTNAREHAARAWTNYNWKYLFLRPTIQELVDRYNAKFLKNAIAALKKASQTKRTRVSEQRVKSQTG